MSEDLLDRITGLAYDGLPSAERFSLIREIQGELMMERRRGNKLTARLIDAEALWQEISGLFGAGRTKFGAYEMLPAHEILERLRLLMQTNPKEE